MEVWLDEYKEIYLRKSPQMADVDVGDISEQIAFREKNQCHPYTWYLEYVAFDMFSLIIESNQTQHEYL